MDYYDRAGQAAEALGAMLAEGASVGIVLGSGFGGLTGSLHDAASMPYHALPHWPPARTVGHDGRAVVGRLGGKTVIALAGRCHIYEGHTPATVTFAVRVLGLLGVKTLILTNAAGGIRSGLSPGALMLIDDHINLMGINPLIGPNEDRFGPRFPDMSEVYSARLRAIADQAGQACQIPLAHGVYAAVTGPSYETPAEIRYLRTIGADAIGMSTVPEAIVARQMGIEVLGVSCISNMAAGISLQPLEHDAVVEATSRAAGLLSSLLEGVVERL